MRARPRPGDREGSASPGARRVFVADAEHDLMYIGVRDVLRVVELVSGTWVQMVNLPGPAVAAAVGQHAIFVQVLRGTALQLCHVPRGRGHCPGDRECGNSPLARHRRFVPMDDAGYGLFHVFVVYVCVHVCVYVCFMA